MAAALAIKPAPAAGALRLRIAIRGAVQGVGFRPFIYRLAGEMGLAGWVANGAAGVVIEVEGSEEALSRFLLRIPIEKPPAAFIQSLESTFLPSEGFDGFTIHESDPAGAKSAVILPDLATCPDCLRELFDPTNRRCHYPFINCTNCGPRYTIIQALPYDRPNTTMRGFKMCLRCQAEYENPSDRRFHAQPNACPECGPQLAAWDLECHAIAHKEQALREAAAAIKQGQIVALKGLGGFQLLVDAGNETAVRELRRRKNREEKPFALMYPSLEKAARHCYIGELEAQLLRSPQAPIVLLQHKNTPRNPLPVAQSVAPGTSELGVMLPYTPLHHLLMSRLGFPVVATSGNLSDEPICTDEHDALLRLAGIADLFLVHDRPIARHVDDSVVRVMLGRELVLRRARGYAPMPVTLPYPVPPAIAYGAHQKGALAVAVGDQAMISQHIGDLDTMRAVKALERVAADLPRLYDLSSKLAVCDLHPDYASTQLAERSGLPLLRVQHHHAHVLSCMAENGLKGPALGVAWDGAGLGTDNTVWGGEFLLVDGAHFERVAHLRPFLLPGGDKAAREPRRVALALLFEIFLDDLFSRHDLPLLGAFSQDEIAHLRTMLRRRLNTPVTTSAGRLFDAVAALIGLRYKSAFEGQAAMLLEQEAHRNDTESSYPMPPIQTEGKLVIDWAPAVRAIHSESRAGAPASQIARKFHNGLVEAIVDIAQHIGNERVVLTGGCFQSRYLTERAVARLRDAGFQPYWHQRVPPNDGGIAVGQLAFAAYNAIEP